MENIVNTPVGLAVSAPKESVFHVVYDNVLQSGTGRGAEPAGLMYSLAHVVSLTKEVTKTASGSSHNLPLAPWGVRSGHPPPTSPTGINK